MCVQMEYDVILLPLFMHWGQFDLLIVCVARIIKETKQSRQKNSDEKLEKISVTVIICLYLFSPSYCKGFFLIFIGTFFDRKTLIS